MMIKRSAPTLLVIATMSLLITGCSKLGTTNKETAQYVYDVEQLEPQIKAFLSCDTSNQLENFSPELEIETNDIYGASMDSMLIYYSNWSIYSQIGKYMYRFQIDKNGLITSYIKYTLEG